MVNGPANGTDWIVASDALGAFVFFLTLHLVFFRFVPRADVLKWLKNLIILSLCVNLGADIFRLKASGMDVPVVILCSAVSALLTMLFIMIYVLGCFGLLESAIRARLIWELYKFHPRPLPLPELTRDYNVETILKARLERLSAAKEILFDGKNYYPGNKMSFFVFKEWIGDIIKDILKRE